MEKSSKTIGFLGFLEIGTTIALVVAWAIKLGPFGVESNMAPIDQSRLLQMRSTIVSQNGALQRAAGRTPIGGTSEGDQAGAFGTAMVDALKSVNAQQSKASDLSTAYERGETHDIVQVMVERQKASLGFEATMQVRNKLLSAYRDIMSMPV